MNVDEYRVIYEVEDSFWWYVGMRSILLSPLDGRREAGGYLRIVDAG